MTFDEAIEQFYAMPGNADIVIRAKILHKFDFAEEPVFLWDGHGELVTEDGQVWLGTQDAEGNDHLEVADFDDGRDGSAPQLEFGLPYVDAETYDKLRTEKWRIQGRKVTRYVCAFLPGEGLRPSTPIDFDIDFDMQTATFNKSVGMESDVVIYRYPVRLIVTNGNVGRSQAPRGTHGPTGQRDRALQMYGIAEDKGDDFIPLLYNRTFLKP